MSTTPLPLIVEQRAREREPAAHVLEGVVAEQRHVPHRSLDLRLLLLVGRVQGADGALQALDLLGLALQDPPKRLVEADPSPDGAPGPAGVRDRVQHGHDGQPDGHEGDQREGGGRKLQRGDERGCGHLRGVSREARVYAGYLRPTRPWNYPKPNPISVSIPCQGGTETVRAPGTPPRIISRSSVSFDGSASNNTPRGLACTSIQYEPLGRS